MTHTFGERITATDQLSAGDIIVGIEKDEFKIAEVLFIYDITSIPQDMFGNSRPIQQFHGAYIIGHTASELTFKVTPGSVLLRGVKYYRI